MELTTHLLPKSNFLQVGQKTGRIFVASKTAIASLVLVTLAFGGGLETKVNAQITPNANDAGTLVNQNDKTLNIQGGTKAGENLLHSFEKFGVNEGQTANFVSNPAIKNILGRVTGGDASVINGLIQVTGGNSNLYLMNPAGIIFGSGAKLNVSGSFTATTANGIGLGDKWFSAVGTNDYANLVGNPNGFAFTQAGTILNAGKLAVNSGQNLTLLGGTVVSTGTISAPGGNITIAAITGDKLIRVTPEGSLLSLALPMETKAAINTQTVTPLSLPQLLTGGNFSSATGATIENGVVKLTGSNVNIESGDVAVKGVNAQTATLSADKNLTLVESQIRTLGDLNLLARDTVYVRDTVVNPVQIQAGGNLLIRGEQTIDILALNHPEAAFQSQGNLSLVSDGMISGDAHFTSGGKFSILNKTGNPGNFVSFYDPIISSKGNVSFGDYTGSSLKVEAGGSIQGGNINITNAGVFPSSEDPDIDILSKNPAVILRAGVTKLQHTPNNPTNSSVEGTTFTFPEGQLPQTAKLPGSIEVGNISTETTTNYTPLNEPEPDKRTYVPTYSVILSAPGEIIAGDIGTTNGSVKLTTTTGNILVNTINTRVQTTGGGNVEIEAGGIFRAQGFFPFDFLNFSGNDSGSSEKFQEFRNDPNSPNGDLQGVPISILTSTFNDPFKSNGGIGGTISIQHRGVSFVERYTPGSIANDVSGTAGFIIQSSGNNVGLYGSLSDRGLFGSGNIQVRQISKPGGDNTLSKNQQQVVQRQVTSQTNSGACNASNTVAINPQPTNSTTRGASTRKATNSASTSNNGCPSANDDQTILKILGQ
jgi:filamentous hemagglutinin family protein